MEIARKGVACRCNYVIDRTFVSGLHINSEKRLVSFTMSLLLSVRLYQRCSHWLDFLEICGLKKSVAKVQVRVRYSCRTTEDTNKQ
jgi:hypothetical protein